MKKTNYLGTKLLVYSVVSILAFVSLLPTYLMLVNATRSTSDILKGISFLPSRYFLQNLATISKSELGVNIWRALLNSTIVSVSGTLLTIYVSALTAYAIKVYPRAKLNRAFYAFILGVMMVPSQINIVGFYKYMARMKMLNNYWPLILPGIASPTTVFFIIKYLESVFQVELVEAGRIDGAGEFHIFNAIMMPIMAPAMATMGLVTLIGNWNSFLIPFIMLSKMELYTTPLMTMVLNINNVTPDYGARYAGLAMSLIPIILVYIFTGKFIIRGISLGGVKG